MSSSMFFTLLAWVATTTTQAAPMQDLVTALPGWDQPLPSRIFSGFIDGGSDVQDGKTYNTSMWYMLVEAEVPNPSSLPLLLWSNGGPGASSAFGLYTEMGPFYVSSESTKTNPPTLFRNPYSWSKLANILILNGPAPVGYSFCNGNPAGNGYACGSWNDTRTYEHNFAFLNNFFEAFPEYKTSELYLSGESYAGVYIGMLASGLLNASTTLNFKGIALGDACMGNQVLCGPGGQRGPWLSLLFTAGQGCISLPTFEAILAECPMDILKNGPISSASPACQAAISASGKECPPTAYYGYNFLDQCPPQAFDKSKAAISSSDPVLPPAQPSGYPCGGEDALTTWVTHPLVKDALHVAPNAVFNSFDNGEGFVYNVTFDSNLPLMRRLQTGADGVRVLMYNGETDPSISSVKTQNVMFGLDFPLKESWRPWTFGETGPTIVAGMVVQWEGNITHATVRGGGHMIPTYKPYSSYLLIKRFLEWDEWPSLAPSDHVHLLPGEKAPDVKTKNQIVQ